MLTILMGVVLVVALALVIWMFTRRASAPASNPPARRSGPAIQPGNPSTSPTLKAGALAGAWGSASDPVAAPAPAAVPVQAMPSELAAFRLRRADRLTTAHKNTLMAELQDIPRPPRSLQKLVSAEYLTKASSSELSDLVMDEPLVSAKVLATVNTPFYGLQNPVSSIGQAMIFLGLNSVRSICLKYMMETSFQTSSPELKKIYDDIWCASAFACELCLKVTQKLQWPDQGTLVTQVLLSFIGRLATASLLPEATVRAISSQGLLERAQAEQKALGLGASEIGGLVLKEWALPDSLVADVRAIDLVLTEPAPSPCPEAQTRLALCYLCARLGEQLAMGQRADLSSFDPVNEGGPELYHFASYWPASQLIRLTTILRSAEIQNSVQQMKASLRT